MVKKGGNLSRTTFDDLKPNTSMEELNPLRGKTDFGGLLDKQLLAVNYYGSNEHQKYNYINSVNALRYMLEEYINKQPYHKEMIDKLDKKIEDKWLSIEPTKRTSTIKDEFRYDRAIELHRILMSVIYSEGLSPRTEVVDKLDKVHDSKAIKENLRFLEMKKERDDLQERFDNLRQKLMLMETEFGRFDGKRFIKPRR